MPPATRTAAVRGTACSLEGWGACGSPRAPSGGRLGGEICNARQRLVGNWFPPANPVLPEAMTPAPIVPSFCVLQRQPCPSKDLDGPQLMWEELRRSSDSGRSRRVVCGLVTAIGAGVP